MAKSVAAKTRNKPSERSRIERKIALYEKALHAIACWGDADTGTRTDRLSMLDEPGSATLAREALLKTKSRGAVAVAKATVEVQTIEWQSKLLVNGYGVCTLANDREVQGKGVMGGEYIEEMARVLRRALA